jgi:hypothetical protein
MRVSDGTGAGSNHPADPESKIITESEVSIEQSRRHVLGIAVTHLSQEPISKRKTQRRYRLTVGATVLFVLVLVLSTAIALLLAPRFKTLPKPNDENSNLEEDGGPASPSNPKLDIEDLRTLCFDGARSFDLTQVSEYLLRERDEFADTLYAIGLKVLQYESMTCFSQNLALLWLAANPPLQVTEQILVNRYVLATIYIALGGWEWARGKDWLQNADHCSWNGIMCNHLGEIVKIHLPKNNMQGQLPEEIGYLSALTSLDVEMNKLTGPLPPTLANLHNLGKLTLVFRFVQLQMLSDTFSLHEVELDISFNRFTGTISESLFQMTQLGESSVSRCTWQWTHLLTLNLYVTSRNSGSCSLWRNTGEHPVHCRKVARLDPVIGSWNRLGRNNSNFNRSLLFAPLLGPFQEQH